MSSEETSNLALDKPATEAHQEGETCEVDEDADNVGESEQHNWSTLTVAALKAELAGRGLQTSGRKADLVARLEASVMGDSDGEPEAQGHGHEAENQSSQENVTESLPVASEASQEEPDETDDEIPEGDEFVEWNEDGDHDVATDDSKLGEDSLKLVDELKSENDEQKDIDELKTSGDKEDVHIEEGDAKNEDGELSVDVHREKDLFHLTWQSKKITVPFKGEIMKDMLSLSKLQTIIVYPVVLADMYSDDIKKYTEGATGLELELEEMLPGKPPKGYLKLKFGTYDEAQQAVEGLKALREGLTVKNFSKDDSESHVLNKLRKEDCERKGPISFRLVYVGNLPAEATEATLREHFPDALQVIIPRNEETLERLGYAYLEYADEKVAYDMSQKYKDAEINGEKLYVIPAISEKKEKYGLLRDSLRLYWSEQVHRLRKILDRPYNRPQWEINDIEQKLVVLKRRLEKDERRRETLRLPIPNFVAEDKKESGHTKAEKDKKDDDNKDKRSSSKKESRSKSRDQRPMHREPRNTLRRSPRRSPPPPRREYRPQRGPTGHASNFPTRREEVADKLVNQLQGLVSALTHKLPTVEPPRPLLDDIQFGSFANIIEQQRRMGGASFNAGGGFRGSTSSFESQGSSRYTAGGKRYHDDDYGGGDRKRRMNDYGNSNSGSGRYGGGVGSRGGAGGHPYNDDRYGGGRRDNNQSSGGGRSYSGRSKWP